MLGTASSPQRVKLDYLPPDQGNLLRALKAGVDVTLDFTGALALLWQIDADGGKSAIGQTILSTELTERRLTDIGAIGLPGARYYYLRGLSLCSSTPGP